MLILMYAQNELGYIGKSGDLMYRIPQDLRRFKAFTNNKTVIMGRRTWESLPDNMRPLPNRTNVVVTRQKDYKAPGAKVIHDVLEYVVGLADTQDEIFIIGGAELIKECSCISDMAYISIVHDYSQGDVKVEPLSKEIWITLSKHYNDGTPEHPAHTFKIMKNVAGM